MAEFSSLNGYTVKDTTARNIAKGRNQAVAYSNYGAMVDALNAMDNAEFRTGQNIYIGTVGVPDLWVYTVEPVKNTFSYESDEKVVELLLNNTTIQVGYYKLAMLEGQKVDLTNVNEAIAENANAIAENASAIIEQNKNLGGLRFGVDGDGNYGYYGADDSLIPFNSIGSLLQYNEILALYEYGDMGESATNTFTASEDMIVFVFGYVRSINYDQYINIETTGKVLNDKLSISKYSYSSGRFTAEVNLKSAFIKLKKGETITTSMYCFNYGQCHCYIIKCNS